MRINFLTVLEAGCSGSRCCGQVQFLLRPLSLAPDGILLAVSSYDRERDSKLSMFCFRRAILPS